MYNAQEDGKVRDKLVVSRVVLLILVVLVVTVIVLGSAYVLDRPEGRPRIRE
jgi:hypothetical protein